MYFQTRMKTVPQLPNRSPYSPSLRYTILVPTARTCVVSFRDRDGLGHSVVVTPLARFTRRLPVA